MKAPIGEDVAGFVKKLSDDYKEREERVEGEGGGRYGCSLVRDNRFRRLVRTINENGWEEHREIPVRRWTYLRLCV